MALKLVKYGVPLSFAYCTVYQQNIWREGDEKLVEEQKESWAKCFRLIYQGYNATLSALKLSTNSHEKNQFLVNGLNINDMKRCWNCNVIRTFKKIDCVVSNPKILGCKIYRTLQPYISSTSDTNKSS